MSRPVRNKLGFRWFHSAIQEGEGRRTTGIRERGVENNFKAIYGRRTGIFTFDFVSEIR